MSIILGSANSFAIFTSQILETTGENNIIKGNIGYNIINGSINLLDGNIYNSETIEWENAKDDINIAISNISILNFIIDDITTDLGTLSPLAPGFYQFNKLVNFNTELILSGNGQYIFYLMEGININILPESEKFMSLLNGATSDDIFFYSPYSIEFGTIGNDTIYGNFISDYPIIINSINFEIHGRLLSTTNNIIINQTNINIQDVSCYLKGSLILTKRNYIKIEDLQKDDEIIIFGYFNSDMTYNYINPIYSKIIWLGKMQLFNINEYPYKITYDNNEIYVSGNHRIIIDDKSYLAKNLNKKQFYINNVIYYHIELEKHSIINVNGFMTESMIDCNNKNQFNKII